MRVALPRLGTVDVMTDSSGGHAREAQDPSPFDALTEDGLRAAGGLKWTRYGDAIGAFVAEMDFGTAPEITAALHEAVAGARFGYLTVEAADGMARACAGFLERRYGWQVPPG